MFGQCFIASQNAWCFAASFDSGNGIVNDLQHFGVLGVAQVPQCSRQIAGAYEDAVNTFDIGNGF